MARPQWYTEKSIGTWERVKAAFANDWEQTKSDFGSKKARDMDQDIDDTVKQATGAKNAFENREQAFRFGHVARQHFANEHPKWDDKIDAKLRKDYDGNYDEDKAYIRHAYEYRQSN